MSDSYEDCDDTIDIHAADFALDPYPTFAELREKCPVVHSDKHTAAFGGFWMLTRYDNVKRAALDWRTFTSSVVGVTAIPIITQRTKPQLPIELDPPMHSRYRALVSPVFSTQRIEQLRPRVQAIADSLVDKLLACGEGDLVSDYAVPLSVQTLAEFTGLPKQDMNKWVNWVRRMFNVKDRADGAIASQEFGVYINELITARRREPTDDFISMLIAQEAEGHRLTDEELHSFCTVVFGAGFETTADTISVMLWWPAEHLDERRVLFAKSQAIPPAVEEFLRYSTPMQIFGRNASHDVELHGKHIKANDAVALAFGSANHDPNVFAEPQRCILDRTPNPHLAFGAGVHLCLGAPGARLEMNVTLQTFAKRLPDYAIPPHASVAWKTRGDRRELNSLPVMIGD